MLEGADLNERSGEEIKDCKRKLKTLKVIFRLEGSNKNAMAWCFGGQRDEDAYGKQSRLCNNSLKGIWNRQIV